MLRSMTGFAARIIALPLPTQGKTNVSINIKSLNSRFFETTCKLQYQLNSLEIELTRLLQRSLYRGHIYLTIQVANQELFHGALEPSLTTVASYLQAIEIIKKKYPISGELTVNNVLELPNIFTVEEKDIDENTKQIIVTTIQELIKELVTAQEKEGAALKKDLEQRIANMERDIGTIEQASGKLIEVQKEKVKKALVELTTETTSLADIQKHAAYVLLDKMDINEEIVRFRSHLKNIHAQLNSEAIEKGKRVDFTLQEMAREINTIAAKCSDATISSLAINIKVELEKAREQVQNIV